MTATLTPAPAADIEYGTAKVAERISGFSDQTLDRWQRAGRDTGRRKYGRMVRYDLAQLRRFLAASDGVPPARTTAP